MLDQHGTPADPAPTADIWMAGDIPIPVEAPPPEFPGLAPIDIPNVHNPIPVIVHGVEYAWDDVSSWVSDRWHSISSWFGDVASITAQDVENVIDNAINTAQTAWSSFVGQLEDWVASGFDAVASTVTDLANYAHTLEFEMFDTIVGAIDAVDMTIWNAVVGIDARIDALEHEMFGALDFTTGYIESWAIDNIYNPLFDDLIGEARQTLDWIDAGITTAEGYAQDLVNRETLERIAAIAGAGTIAAAITTWIAECGEPMCQVTGPNTDWGKWLKLFGPTAIWAMLAAVAAENPQALEGLAEQLASALGPTLERWTAGALIGGGSFPPQPSDVGGAIGRNPLGL